MTILEEEKQIASTVGTTIPSSIISSSGGGTGLGPVNLKNTVTAALAAAAAAVPTAASTTNKTPGDPGINNNTGAKNHILNSMISNVADRYITPEYLAPLPSSEKTGKSPLQLLAQTCSQIGADPGSNKNSSSGNGNGSNSLENKTKEKSKAGSPALIVADNAVSPIGGSGSGTQVSRPVSFKPYETDRKKANKTPSSVVSLSPTGSNNNNINSSPPTKSPTSVSASASTGSSNKTTTASSSASSETTPVIRSGMEVLAGHPKDLPLGLYANPAFRPPLSGGSSAHGAAYPGAGAASLIPPTTLAASLAAAAAGSLGSSVCRDPYCRDPTCPTAMYNAQLAASLMASGLPPGYAELLQAHKATSTAAAAASAANGAGPYICNWMNGREGYCGKRHNSAEELLQHLRTHTNLSTSDSAMYSASAHAAASFQRGYGSALSSMSSAASRFHPYAAAAAAAAAAAKTSALPSSLSALGVPPVPPPIPGLPPSLYSPAAASSLYASLYGARLAGSLQ